jgi:hypothetical protein
MILLVTPSERASRCAAALHDATNEEVVVAESLVQATTLLRADSYLAVVFDQYLLETELQEAETALEHLGTAIPVQVNLAISGMERLVREVRAAVQRRQREEVIARQAALCRLHSELNCTITALLLSSELALETPGLPAAAFERLQTVDELVKKLRRELENAATTEEFEPRAGTSSGFRAETDIKISKSSSAGFAPYPK